MQIKGAKIVYRPEVIEEAFRRWDGILKSGWVILGDQTVEFEKLWAGICNRRHGIAVSNDTAALELAMRPELLDLKGHKLVVPAQGFFSIVTALDRNGAEPFLVDIDIENGNASMTLEHVQRAYEEDETIKAVCLMPIGGLMPRDTLEIIDFCHDHGLYVLEDAAHGHGTEILDADGRSVLVGALGDISCFSFYATKVLNTAEGGMVLVDDDSWAAEAQLYRNYGRTGAFGSSTIIRDGNNWRITEFIAALGCAQMYVWDRIVEERRRVALRWLERSQTMKHLYPLPITPNVRSNYYKFIMMAPPGFTLAEKQALKAILWNEHEIEISGDVYDLPIHCQPIYKDRPWALSSFYPQSEEFADRHICMPFYEFMTDEEIDYAAHWIDRAMGRVLKP